MFTIDTVSDFINGLLNKMDAVNKLPPLLLYCTSIKRTGISPMKISANIIARNESLGISTSENPDGTPNVVNQFVYNVVEGVTDGIKNDAAVSVVIPSGMIQVQAFGANAGGPVTCVGTNVNNVVLPGIIQ